MINRIGVIAVTYNRPSSLLRLLSSLKSAYYDEDKVDLIISIDKSEIEQEIIALATNFDWKHGDKRIRTFEERQGLRNHILQCGDLVRNYDAVIVFEDDIIAAPNYYLYVKSALEYYKDDARIAGISLYLPEKNVMTGKPFTPMRYDSDVFFMQCAQSWGQCWSKNMWLSFSEWYKENGGELKEEADIPKKVSGWPKSSWLKYYMKYTIKTNKYFVYPYDSLSSNASDKGEHNRTSSNAYQVPMLYGRENYNFTPLDKGVKYDVFFERQGLASALADFGIQENELCIDLYGSKISNNGKRYIITNRRMEYKIIQTFGLEMRPHEANIIYRVNGSDIFLYDLGKPCNIELTGKINQKAEIMYYSTLPWKSELLSGLIGFKSALLYKLKKR